MRRFFLFLEVWAVVALMLALPTPALAQTAPAQTPSPTAYTDSVQGIEFTEGTVAEVVADMSVQGGSVDGTTIPSGGTGTFSGMLDHTPLSQGLPPTINGTLQVTL